MSTMKSFLGVKKPGNEAEHLPPYCAKVMKEWSYCSIPPVFLHRKTSPLQLHPVAGGNNSHITSANRFNSLLVRNGHKNTCKLAHSIHHILLANYLLQRGGRIRILNYFLGISNYEGKLIPNTTGWSFTWFCPNYPYHLEEKSELPFCTYVLQQIRGSQHDAEPSLFVSCSENIRLLKMFTYTKHRLISYGYVQFLNSVSG
jgi:hypothetical protein